ncbi:hypothetical protein OF83DRAFT_1177920 [Amylostereum chailletii]|nr:hypothetical protein OF83DRAFT_1177920 [Amylostereum chailletii]
MPRTYDDIRNRRYSRLRRSMLLSLPNDILVELLNNPVLSLTDILRLRQVCRHFYKLTHQPVIWKRILYDFHLPLQPLPPSHRYSLSSLSSIETETMIARAITADVNWKSVRPKIHSAWKLPAYNKVCSLKMVPGGKFMLAAIHDDNRYAISLFMMDHRVKTVYPVAKCLTRSRPYSIEAKYMPYHGSQGLMVTKDPSVYSDDADNIPFSLRYEMVVMHNDLKSLEALQDPTCPPGCKEYQDRVAAQPSPPFGMVTTIRSYEKFDFVDMDVLDGDACLVYTQGRNVTMKNLETRAISTFTCGPLPEENPNLHENQAHPLPYRVRAMRILPPQREILIVRTNSYNKADPITLELFTLPSSGTRLKAVYARSIKRYWEGCYFQDVKISYHGLPLACDQSVLASLCPHAEPPPLYIYTVTLEPWGTACYRLWPERVTREQVRSFVPGVDRDALVAQGVQPDLLIEGEDTHYDLHYPLNGVVPSLADTTFRYHVVPPHPRDRIRFKSEFTGDGPNQRLRFLAGSVRPLLYGVDIDDRSIAPTLLGLHAYADLYGPPDSVVDRQLARWPQDLARREAAARVYESFARGEVSKRRNDDQCIVGLVPVDRVQKDIPVFNVGLVAIAWEDWTAKLCLVSQREPTTIYMLEYAHTPGEDEDGNRRPLPVDEVDQEFRRKYTRGPR